MAVTTKSDPSGSESSERPKSKRRGRRGLVFLLAVALLVAAAPTLVTKTPLKGVALTMVTRTSSGGPQVSVGSISAGWLSPISVTDIELRQDGDLHATVPALSMDRTLLGLLFDRTNLGRVQVERPVIEARLQEDRSKVQEELDSAPAVVRKAEKIGIDLEVIDGTVILHDTHHQRDFKLEQLAVDLHSIRFAGDNPGASLLQGVTGRVQFTSPGGDFAGFVTGPAQVEAELADGLVRVSPLAVDVSGGRLTVSPRLELKDPWRLEVEPGRLVDHVHVSPEMCNGWLKFALPVLAEATQVEGEFSIDLQQCSVPLAAPKTGETAGAISIHSIELGPGPLVEQLTPLLDKLNLKRSEPLGRLSIARESQVEFRLADGRVYHQGLRLELPQMTVETSGSVGFDESLAMTAEIHLPLRRLGDSPLAEILRSQPLKLAVGGTLKKPKVDLPELGRLNRENLRDTARDLLRSGVRRELDRLLKPKED
ncbi:MAG TPA: hypothetical protein VG826_00240 [Pirellulales bacterium]|nr:hypothetical protein [Pirellulales bacterium]